MALEEFATCYAGKVEVTVDGILAIANQIGEEGVRRIRDTWNSLSENDRAVISWVAGASSSTLKKILEKVLGVELAAIVLVPAGGVAWGILIGSFVACADEFV